MRRSGSVSSFWLGFAAPTPPSSQPACTADDRKVLQPTSNRFGLDRRYSTMPILLMPNNGNNKRGSGGRSGDASCGPMLRAPRGAAGVDKFSRNGGFPHGCAPAFLKKSVCSRSVIRPPRTRTPTTREQWAMIQPVSLPAHRPPSSTTTTMPNEEEGRRPE